MDKFEKQRIKLERELYKVVQIRKKLESDLDYAKDKEIELCGQLDKMAAEDAQRSDHSDFERSLK